MNIGMMRVRITIQRNATIVDDIGNHKSIWEDYYTCWATASESTGKEDSEGSHTDEADDIYFTVRYCSELKALTSKGYRVILEGRIYDISHVNMMGYKRNSIRLSCSLRERS